MSTLTALAPVEVVKRLLQPGQPPLPKPEPKPKPKGIVIGYRPDGSELILTDKQRSETHTQVIGSTGFGKSFYLYSIFKQEALRDDGRGCLLIEPHGELIGMAVNFCMRAGIAPGRVILIEPNDKKRVVRMCPLSSWGEAGVGVAMDALIRLAGEVDTTQTPRLRRYLYAALAAVREAGGSLAMVPEFLRFDPEGEQFRYRVLNHVTTREVKQVWQAFALLKYPRNQDMLDSSGNRVIPFLAHPAVRRMNCSEAQNLDWREVLDSGKIVLVNLGQREGYPDRESLTLIGTLILMHLRQAAAHRPFGAKPFSVICDEFGSYVSEDYADALDQLRKWGILFTVSHQRVDQLSRVSDNVLSAVLGCCKTKLIFGGLGREDAQVLAKEVFTGEVSGEVIKHSTQTVSFRPVEDSYPVITRGHVESHSEGFGRGKMLNVSQSHNLVSGVHSPEIFGIPVPFGAPPDFTSSEGGGKSEGESESYFYSDSYSDMMSVTEVKYTRFEEFLQDPSVQFSSLEEEWEKRFVMLMTMPSMTVAVKRYGEPVELVKTIFITKDEIKYRPHELEAYKTLCHDACPASVPVEAADAEWLAKLISHGLENLPLKAKKAKAKTAAPDTQVEVIPPPAAGNGHAVDELGL